MIIEPLFDQMVQVRPAAAYSCNPDGESLLLAAAIPMENPYCSCKLTRSGRTEPLRRGAPACGHHALARDAGESRPTAAIPMDNPYCSCKLTRVRSRCRRTSTSSTSPPRTWTRSSASSPPRSSRGPSPCTPLYQPPAVIKHGLSSNLLALITSDCAPPRHARPEDPACCDQIWTVLQLVGPDHLGVCCSPPGSSCTPRRPPSSSSMVRHTNSRRAQPKHSPDPHHAASFPPSPAEAPCPASSAIARGPSHNGVSTVVCPQMCVPNCVSTIMCPRRRVDGAPCARPSADFIMATYLADRVIVYEGTPSVCAKVSLPQRQHTTHMDCPLGRMALITSDCGGARTSQAPRSPRGKHAS